MAIKYKINCSVCKLCRGNPKLRGLIYQATFYGDESDYTLLDIAKEYGLNIQPMYNHSRKHITKNENKTPVVVERHIEKLKAQIAKETELAIDHDGTIPKEDYERVLDGVLAEGLAQLKQKGKTITISQLLTAAKIKGDFQAKKRGQDIEVIKSMYKFASGAKKEQDEPTPKTV